MQSCESVYYPREDSTMLEKWVRKHSKGKVLDVGTGSGIQAIAAAQNHAVTSVLAADIQKGVIEYCKKNINNKKIRFIQSDLFENIHGKFDTIIFNPPYLPRELKLRDLTIEGGRKGYEVIERFLNDAAGFLKPEGIVLMVFSSLTKKEKVRQFISNSMLEFLELEKTHIFFEDIYVYLLSKSRLLKTLEGNKTSEIKYLAKGHRGFIFTGKYRNKKVVIKVKNPESMASGRIKIEADWLRRLNRHGIGPKLIYSNEDYLVCEYIKGDLIADFIKKSGKSGIKKIIKKILNQAFILDKLRIDKEEMHHPVKHILIRKNKPYMIDFERANHSQRPKNVTQLCQFLTSRNLSAILNEKGLFPDKNRIIRLAKIYKRKQSDSNFREIVGAICR